MFCEDKMMDDKMSGYPNKESCQVISKQELKCVWMTAGLLSYKLCKYDLQCEKCPLDWELRNLSSTPSSGPTASLEERHRSPDMIDRTSPLKPEGGKNEEAEEDLSHLNIKESLFYHHGHTWIKVEKADEVRIGVDSFLGKIVGQAKVIVLPLPGTRGVQGENLCSIIQEEGIVLIASPVSGLIISVNQKLKNRPELVSQDPLGDGFLLTLKPKNFQRDQKNLLSGQEACAWHRKEWERFKEAILSELPHEAEGIGLTMQDGRIRLKGIRRLIGAERYIQMINTFLRK
jgi:glycine cleavage system H protein